MEVVTELTAGLGLHSRGLISVTCYWNCTIIQYKQKIHLF